MLAQCTADVAGDVVDAALVWPVLRFGEINPLTGRAYTDSWFRELPEYAAEVVTDVLGMAPGEWDALVRAGAAGARLSYAVARLGFSVGSWLVGEAGRRAGGVAPEGVCGDCWGSCVAFDSDGSMTGTVGVPIVCVCAVRVVPTVCAGPVVVRRVDAATGRVGMAAGVGSPVAVAW